MTRNDYVQILKKAAIKRITESLVRYCISKLPFLAMPIINPIFALIASKIVIAIAEETEMRVMFLYVDLRTDYQCEGFKEAALEWERDKSEKNEKILIDKLEHFISLLM
jgi:hypothetical protein